MKVTERHGDAMRPTRAAWPLALLLSSCVAHYHEVPPPPPPTAPPSGVQESAPSDVPSDATEAAPASSSRAPQTSAGESAQKQEPSGPLPPLPSQAPKYAPAPDQAPPASDWVRSYPDGQWVYASGYGWIWVPDGATTTAVEGVPYAYLYTPHFGWTWYLSPWGGGAYHYGMWVTHPWRPVGWHRHWVAHPHVVVRLGRPHHHR
jgi:hypothetical protein